MPDLIKTEKKLLELPPISREKEASVYDTVKKEIIRSYAYTRYKQPSVEELTYDVGEVTKIILTYAKQLRLEEIGIAFRNMVMGKYGDYPGLSVATFSKAILNYLSSGEREDRVKKEKKLIAIPENAPPTKEEWDRKCTEKLKKAFEVVSGGEFYDDSGNILYKWLNEKGLIPFSPDRKKAFMKEAEKQLSAEKSEEKKLVADPLKRRLISQYIQSIEAGKERKGIVKVRAMKIALNQLISDNLELGNSVEDFINN